MMATTSFLSQVLEKAPPVAREKKMHRRIGWRYDENAAQPFIKLCLERGLKPKHVVEKFMYLVLNEAENELK